MRTILLSLMVFSLNAGAAELSNLLSTKESTKQSKYKIRTSFEWVQRSVYPMFHDPEEADFTTESLYGVRFKYKKHKLSFRLSSLHDYNGDAIDGETTKHQLGDGTIRYVDSRFKGLFYDTDLIMTHKLYIPMRDRSIERTEITHWKGWFLLSHYLTPRWTLIGNFIPTAFAFRQASYTPAGDDEAKPNALYDLFFSGQIVYTVSDVLYVSAELGWARREYLRFEDETRREDTIPIGVGLNYIYSDDLEISLGLSADNPTNQLKFNRITPFPRDYTAVVLETSLAVF